MNEKPTGHHILFTRRTWEAQEPTRLLRRHALLIPKMQPAIHALLHESVISVPLLDHRTGRLVHREYEDGLNTISSIDRLMSTIDRVSGYDCVGYLEYEQAQLTIHGIHNQIPFIKEGLVNGQER